MTKTLVPYTDLTISAGPSKTWNHEGTEIYISWNSPEDGSIDMSYQESEGIGEIVIWTEEKALIIIPAVTEQEARDALKFFGYQIVE